jgi:ketosteroid isomerase-like protein
LPSSTSETNLGFADLEKSLESTVLESYVQLTFGNIEAFLDGVALGRSLHFVGVLPKDVAFGVNPPALQKDRRLYKHRNVRILSKNLDVHLSEDGSVGWVYDEISYRVEYMGREASIPIRSTAVYIRDVERWVQVAEHLSYGIPTGEIISLAARDELREGPPFKTDHGDSRRLSASLVGLVARYLNGSSASHNLVFDAPDSLVLLPAAEQEFHASEAAEAPALAETFSQGTTAAIREFRVQYSPSKRVAWVVANIGVRTSFNGDPLDIQLRGSFVLEKRKDKGWGLVQTHISVPLLERQLSERVFGPAGS